jgi:tripartite-type tricarboxylate transporter receptor subunit TctC
MKIAIRKSEKPRRRSVPRGNERRLVTQHPRRRILSLTAAAVALPSVSRIAWGQAYPSRPVRIIVGFPPGGGSDIYARMMAQWLSERFGQPFIVDNRAGASGNIAAEAVIRAQPDGYTLLQGSQVDLWNMSLFDNLKFNFIRDIAPVARISSGFGVIAVNPSFPARTVPDLIANAKANPGKINMGSGGIGTPQHIYGELFKSMAGVNMLHVPYRGEAPALTDLIAGQVQVMFPNLSTSIEHVKSGRLRALAVTNATRSPLSPEIPTVGEFLPGYEGNSWSSIFAPKNTPTEIVEKLNREINLSLTDSRIKQRIADLGATPTPMTVADFSAFIVEFTEKWAKVIRAANIKPE